jgi:hypothetical protein
VSSLGGTSFGLHDANRADDLPKADALLDKYVEALGGKAAFGRIHSEISNGSMEFPAMGLKAKVITYNTEPNLHMTEMTLEGIGKIQEGNNGEVAWSLSAMQGPRVKDGDEKAETLLASRLNAESMWRDIYTKVETVGTETFDGKDCYKVAMTSKAGSTQTRWLDKQSGLMLKSVNKTKTAMGEIESESIFADYRKDGEILHPHKVAITAGAIKMAITMDSVQYNAEIPKDKFDVPAEIQALLKKPSK